MRYLIKFTKGANIKFISHLDLMRTIQKIIRRSELPIDYSKGFNPHMALSLAQPLSVGVYSDGEYMDIVLKENVDTNEVIEKLNKNSSENIKFLEASTTEIILNEKRVPQAMALLDAANYTVKIKYADTSKVEEEVNELMSKAEWTILKKSKKGEKMADIKPLVKELKFWVRDEYLVINTTISCGSRETLSANLLATFIKENTTMVNEEAFVEVKREEMYALKDDKLIPLYKYI